MLEGQACKSKSWDETWVSLMAQVVKNLPAMQETQDTWVRYLEDVLEEEKTATHSSILAWEIPWTEEFYKK